MSVIGLFLYSKGWSPQFLVWVLAFVVLLLPTFRGMVLAIMLSFVNFIEADIFLIMLPNTYWLLWATVLLRTMLLMLLALEFLGQIWPRAAIGHAMRRAGAALTWAIVAAACVGAVAAAPQAAQAYQSRRLAQHPCRTAITYLQDQAPWPNHTILTQQADVWQEFYPWLRNLYELRVLDGYSPDRSPEDVALEKLNAMALPGEFWWVERTDLPFAETSPASVRTRFFAQPAVHQLEEQTLGACRLYRVIRLDPAQRRATVTVTGGPIVLDQIDMTPAKVGGDLRLVLYWHGVTPVAGSYTVFTQLFDAAGRMVAQQDNLPVRGLAPTNTWQPGAVVRDPYRLAIPSQVAPGGYHLLIGLYDHDGRRVLTLPNGTKTDHLSLAVQVGT